MLTASTMDEILGNLRLACARPGSDDETAGLGIMADWTTRELLLADERSRKYRLDEGVLAGAAQSGGRLATYLISMGRDGFGRQRAVVALAEDADATASRLLALRMSDPVEIVRLTAWRLLARRTDAGSAVAAAPVLVALRTRPRSIDALSRYADSYAARAGRPLWAELMEHPDRACRRWAVTQCLGTDAIQAGEALELLARERDQWVADLWVSMVLATGEAPTLRMLLTSRWAAARESALLALASSLPDAEVTAALYDRSMRVQTTARYLATKRGIDVGRIYRQRWDATRDPRALVASARCGERLPPDVLAACLDDPDPRVRTAATSLIEVTADVVGRLFALLDDSAPGVASAATRALATANWEYATASDLWPTAGATKRQRLWRLLSSRSGWDRVRGDLLAADDPNPAVQGKALADLRQWHEGAAARIYRRPDPAQESDLAAALATVALPHDLRNEIEFRAGLPLTPRPVPRWSTTDAAALVALTGTGGPLGRTKDLRGVVHAYDAHNHDVPTLPALARALGRLRSAGLVEVPTLGRYRLTTAGRRLTRGLFAVAMTERAERVHGLLRPVPFDDFPLWIDPAQYNQVIASR